MKLTRLDELRRRSGLPTPPKRWPPLQPTIPRCEWPINADSTVRADPVWQDLLVRKGRDTVKKMIDQQRAEQEKRR